MRDLDGNSAFDDYLWLDSADLGHNVTTVGQTIVSAGNYRFYFSTKPNGVTYSGLYADPLYLHTV